MSENGANDGQEAGKFLEGDFNQCSGQIRYCDGQIWGICHSPSLRTRVRRQVSPISSLRKGNPDAGRPL